MSGFSDGYVILCKTGIINTVKHNPKPVRLNLTQYIFILPKILLINRLEKILGVAILFLYCRVSNCTMTTMYRLWSCIYIF